MTRKNIFNFIIVYIIGFLSLFCNFDIKIDRNDNIRYIKFAIFNQIYADENNYEYNTTEGTIVVRRNKDDPDLKGGFSDRDTKWLSNLSWIPGVGAMIQSFTYIGQGLSFGMSDIKKAFTGDISSILTGAGMIMDVLAMSDGESDSVIALDQTFSSNLYCRYQNIYEEETDLVHRSGPAYRGGLEHPIFPIYPLDIKVNDETGLCDLEKSGIIDNDKNFINIGDGGASSQFLRPLTTKCSYSYTAASEQCVKELSSPILTTYNVQKTVADIVCTIASAAGARKAAKNAAEKAAQEAAKKASEEVLEKAAKEAIEKAAQEGLSEAAQMAAAEAAKEAAKEAAEEAAKKAAEEAMKKATTEALKHVEKVSLLDLLTRSVLPFFTDNRFVYDPVNLMAILGVEFTFDFLMTALTGIPTNPASAIAYAVCLATTIGAYAAFTYGVKAAIAIIANKHYKKARDTIKNYKFCGYDWFTYAKTSDGKYYTKGINTHSYYKGIYDCINGITDKEGGECGKISNDNICTDNDEFCKTSANQKISKTNKDVKNRVFREYVYGGKEYDAGAIEESILKSGKKFDNRAYLFKDGGYDRFFCIDPRTPEQKGFKSVYQKYYMRGNDKANFACNRFYYDGKSPCILYQNQIYEEDKKYMESLENGKYYLIPYGKHDLINKYSKQCQEAFIEARKCCQYRSRHLICLENQQTSNSTFCFSNVVEEYSDENTKMTNNIVDLFKNVQNEGDFFKYTCELDGVKFEATKKVGTNHVCVFSYGLCPYDFKLNAGLNYKATYCDANTTDPNLDVNNTLKRGSTHFNADDCRKGIFSADIREDYKGLNESSSKFASFVFDRVSKDMGCNGTECEYNKNDFKTIYNYEKVNDIINNKTINELTASELRILSEMNCDLNDMSDCRTKYNNIFEKGITAETDTGFAGIAVTKYNLSQYLVNNLKTSAYGQIKNFCQYRAHCVEVEEERLTTEREDSATLFMDSSCTGYTNNSRNLLPGSVVGLPRQLSAPIVECIHESLKNLINGVAGNSLCKEGHAINNEGFCDSDTAESIETAIQNKDTKFFEEKYQKRADDIEKRDVYIVKGQLLPTNYNPFLKLQRNFINVIRTALTLFLVIYFYKLLLLGKLGDFTKPENVGKLVFNLFKFSLVIWLIFYNGWQQGVYNRLVNFSSGTFNFVNDLLVKVINNKSNQMLSLKGAEKRLDIEKYDRISETEDEDFRSICYRYDIFDNISYKNINELTGYCDKGYTRVDKDKIYVGYKENKRYQEKGKLVISTNQEMAKLVSFIDEYNDTSSNKLILYRMDNNRQTVSVAADSNPKGEDLYGANAITYNVDQVTPYDETNVWSKYYDGCYFDTTEYKEGKSYLALFDTLDCKFIRYLGFSTDKMVPNLIMFSVMMIAPNYLFKGFKTDNNGISLIKKVITTVGSVLFGLAMSFVFIMFNVVIKVLYVFLSSFFTLSILIFVSPIILPLMFYERTKKMVDTWFELIIDTVIKPTFNLCIMVFYINLLDIILLKNVMFIKHDWRGRGASLNCYSGAASSFVCLVNNLIGGISPDDIKGLFADGLISFLLDMLMIVMLFVLSDSMLETFDNIVKQIFNFMSNGNGASVIGLSGGNSVAGSEGKSVESSILGEKQKDSNGNEVRQGGAMGVGKSLEAFRANYLTKAPGAALDSFINKTSSMDGKIGKIGKGLKTAREAVRKGDEKLRASASRIAKINAKRISDNFKAGFSNLGSNIKTLGKNIGSSNKKMEKLKNRIEDNKNRLDKIKKEIEKPNNWYNKFTKYYYEDKKNKLENEIENLEEELIEREENKGKLEYKSLFNTEDQKNLKRKKRSAAKEAQKIFEEKKKEDKENDELTEENEKNKQVETEKTKIERNNQTNTEKNEQDENKEVEVKKNEQNENKESEKTTEKTKTEEENKKNNQSNIEKNKENEKNEQNENKEVEVKKNEQNENKESEETTKKTKTEEIKTEKTKTEEIKTEEKNGIKETTIKKTEEEITEKTKE